MTIDVLSRNLAMLAGHWPSVSGYVMYLICQLTSQDLAIKGLCYFMGRRSLLHKHCDSEEITVFICHVISQDNVILKGHAALWLGSRQGKSPACHNWCP